MDAEIKSLIERYRLEPHPEGGWYREVYRSSLHVESSRVAAMRPAMTHIYFLLGRGECSRFHRVAHDELWHFYAGDPLNIYMLDENAVTHSTLGLTTEPMVLVRAGVYQAAETTGAYTLVGCSVAPGFDFADFTFLADSPAALAAVKAHAKEYMRLV